MFRKNIIKNEIELGNLIIKFIEVVPIQITKIKNYFFKAMSNGEDIDLEKLYVEQSKKQSKKINENNIKLKVDKYANYINFGMKNSILNFYDLLANCSFSFYGGSINRKKYISKFISSIFF